MARTLRYYERVLLAAADIQGDTPPSSIPDHDQAVLASVPALPDGTPASDDQLTEALSECERRGWMKLIKVFGPWSWSITPAGLETADALRTEASLPGRLVQTEQVPSPPPPPVLPTVVTGAPRDPGQLVLQVVFDALVANAAWPTFQYVERRLGPAIDATEVLRSLPASLVSFDRVLNPDSLVRLRPEGVARCEGSSAVISAFTWLLRWLARREAAFEPESATKASYPQLSSDDAVSDWLRDNPGGRAGDLYLAFLLLELVPDVWSGLGGSQASWTVTPNRRIQRFADVTSLQEYLDAATPKVDIPIVVNGPRLTADVAYRALVSGFAADAATGKDAMGVGSEAFAIADLITHRSVAPPLCVGIFGQWGSGKSFFMRLVSQRVASLAKLRAAAASSTDVQGEYCTNIVQVRFNAWHYIESNLWASLAATIFSALADSVSTLGMTHETLRKEVFSQLETARLALEVANHRLDFAKASSEQAEETLRARQRAAAEAQHALASRTLGQVSAEDPNSHADAAAISAKLGEGSPRVTLRQLEELSKAGRSVAALWSALGHLPPRAKARVLGGVLLPVLGALLLLLVLAIVNEALALGFSVPLSGVGVLGTLVLVYRLQQSIVPAAQRLVQREQSRLGAYAALEAERRAQLDADAAVINVQAAQADLAIVEELEKGSPYRFVLDRYAATDYTNQLGLAAIVQRDFQKLAALLEKPLVGGSQHRLERIVLYVDDLDRCPPAVVLEVLQAVHLLLAFPLFVVVIGVDVEWLYRAIAATNQIASGDVPHRYVEKIIQIPFWIRPMDANSFTALINDTAPAGGVAAEPYQPEAVSSSTAGPADIPQLVEVDSLEPQPVARLILTPPEVNALARMSAFVQTPRAAKRLVNVYRLLKCLTGPAASRALESGDHVTVLLQLALLCGMPERAKTIFEHVRRSGRKSLWDAISELRGDSVQPTAATTRVTSQPVATDVELIVALDALLSLKATGEVTTEAWNYWGPLSARFAFLPPET